MARAVGIDFGDRRIGVAVSDPGGSMAFPHDVITYSGKMGEALRLVAERVEELAADRVVVGMPYNMDGSRGRQADRTASFVGELKRLVGERAQVLLWDERLTSVQAERLLQDAGVRSRDQRGKVDKIAAALILQGFLDQEAAARRAES